ncbi:MAG: hypothetical protein A2941_01880 [Candidatus Yanofskybacteria bacterium RIFCSPLOWO2_01_FULL_49_17]|uniref:Uncharacterized protein n=1 Tax=Candidatus Yanofskybacteria bacterium RIFCSPLOWO2_01_FULL_49_17 TaxID=1802700 RepID=A0A1F8GS85_9BACT|nr:MAG: hypothetical protein A2941_01880 [Candidatus Yanofskybacteria bacterium RIFCSPLOWO2_01_FULL_49_17]
MLKNVLLAVSDIPKGNPITFQGIDDIIGFILDWLIRVSGTVMIIALVLTGILMLSSRGDPKRFEAGKQMLKTTIWGSAVIFGAGFILELIAVVFTGGVNVQPVTDLVSYIVDTLGNLLIGLSGAAMVIALVVNGMQMITAGQDQTKFTKARQSLANVLWGSAVILGAGLIINLLRAVFRPDGLSLAPVIDLFSYIVGAIGNFLIGLSTIVMITFIVISGMMMATAGQDPAKFQKARKMLVNVIWGSLVIMGSGVILNTIYAVITGEFFCRLSISTPWIGVCLWQ